MATKAELMNKLGNWRDIVRLIVTILTAILTALTTQSCFA